MRDVKRLICPYPPNAKVDRVLKTLGEDFGYDSIHNADNTEEREVDSDASDEELPEHCEDDASEDAEEVDTAVAGDGTLSAVAVQQPGAFNQSEEPTELSVGQAEQVHVIRSTIGALQGTIEALKSMGVLRSVHHIEAELKKEQRKERELLRQEPAVAETCMRLRKAEALEFQQNRSSLRT